MSGQQRRHLGLAGQLLFELDVLLNLLALLLQGIQADGLDAASSSLRKVCSVMRSASARPHTP
jgi:hypothetical protein